MSNAVAQLAQPDGWEHLPPRDRAYRLRVEWHKAKSCFPHFVDRWVYLKDEQRRTWARFRLWPAQRRVGQMLVDHRLVILLKARQIGMTWLALAYVLWLMVFHGAGTYLLFSVGLREAKKLLTRLRGMYERLPSFLQAREASWSTTDGRLSTGAEVVSLPSGTGDSYTASGVVADEADLVDDQEAMDESVKPTVADGGWYIKLSKVDKDRPDTLFKRTYREAKKKEQLGTQDDDDWRRVFLPWHARPTRTQAWYERELAEATALGQIDVLWANYPATDEEALRPRQIGKRIPGVWLAAAYEERRPALSLPGSPPHSGLRFYTPPIPGVQYVVGADCAEGVPGGDDSGFTVMRKDTGEAVCHGAGAWEPKHTYGAVLRDVAAFYNNAAILVERNNHGHAVIAWLESNAPELTVLCGPDGRPGWSTTAPSKAALYNTSAGEFKAAHDALQAGRPLDPVLYDAIVQGQLGSIERGTLAAPGKKKGRTKVDDEATGYVLAQTARGLEGTSSNIWGEGYSAL